MKKFLLLLLIITVLSSDYGFSKRLYIKQYYENQSDAYNYTKLTLKLKNNSYLDKLTSELSSLNIKFMPLFNLNSLNSNTVIKTNISDESRDYLMVLSTYYSLDLTGFKPDSSIKLANRLNELPEIDIAYFEPAFYSAPATPDFTSNQLYLTPAETGLGYNEIKHIAGAKGSGIKYCDVELGINFSHEDFDSVKIKIVKPDSAYNNRLSENHGVAVVGIAAALDNEYGITGMITDADIYIRFPCYGINQGIINVNQALIDAAEVLSYGDVMLIELQISIPYGQNSIFAPIEYLDATFDALKYASSKGIIVIEAGGNGNQSNRALNLDTNLLEGRFDISVRNSGTLLISAGTKSTNKKMSWAPYGNRIDLFANGELTMTLGYGDIFHDGNSGNRKDYTNQFGGTSGASAIIAAAAVSLQGIYYARTGNKLGPQEMRDILYNTGTMSPLVVGSPKKIGRMPNLKAAYDYIITTNVQEITNNSHSKIEFAFLQNNNIIKILNWSAEMLNRKLSVYDVLGREVIHYDSINYDEIDIERMNLERGVYFIVSNGTSFKFISR